MCHASIDGSRAFFRALLFAGVLLFARFSGAVPACPSACKVQQPDGTIIDVCLQGDEFGHWVEDGKGHTLLKDAGGRWVYAMRDEAGNLVPGAGAAGRDDPAKQGLKRHLKPPIKAGRGDAMAGGAEPKVEGRMANLVLLVDFPDLPHTFSKSAFRAFFNRPGYAEDGAAGSVKDYYEEVSYGRLHIESVVVDWIRLDHGYAYYGADQGGSGRDSRPRQMVQEALAKLQARGFDFSTVDADKNGEVDMITVVHAGGGQEFSMNDSRYIWSHQWEMEKTVSYDGTRMRTYLTVPERRGLDAVPGTQGITRVGVVCHEMAHTMGLPDLYDLGFDSQGVGDFCLMGSGAWNGDLGSAPSHPSAWCKAMLKWVSPVELTGSGVVEAPRVEDNPVVFRLGGAFPPSQYFLVENRQGVGFDSGLPGKKKGLLIWHIDETVADNNNQKHYKVDLEEASGRQDLERNINRGDSRDYFRRKNKTSFTSSTTPDNRSYAGEALGLDVESVSKTADTMTFTILDENQAR